MSISSENRKAGPYTGNGIAASFTFSFKVFSASDVVVTRQVIATGAETTLVLLTDYTVTLNGNQELNPGGSVVLPAALASTFKLTITSGVANLQPTTLTNAGGFYPTVINDSLDRATILTQQLRERLLRSISYPVSDPTNVATTLPAAAQRASKVLSFDVNGAPETSFSALDVQNAQSNAAAASASAAAALASENAAAASALSASGSASSASSSATAAASSATAAQNAVSQIQWNDVVFINSNLTVDSTYRGKLIAVDTSSGNVTVSLPAISSLDLTTPFVIGIKKSDASGNVVNIAPNGADLINNQASKTVSVLDAGTTLIPDMDPAPDQWSALDFGAISGNMVKDTFSGNGSQTVFTLTTVPASKNNTQVFISGVYQAKSNYNLVGSTVTFLLAPPSGTNNIEVISGTTLSIGVPSDGVVSNTKLANMSSQTIKGRTSAGVGSPEDLTAAQATAILNPFTGDSGAGGVKGLVPAPASGDAAQSKFLKADGTWAVSGLGGGSKNYYATSNANPNFSSGSVSPFSACSLTLSSGVPSGAPSLTATQMAISANSTNPLLISQSAFNLQLTKSAANAQGQGFISSVLTIDREDVAKVLTGTFSYEVVSGTIDLSGASTQSLEIWVYNVTANQWIQPAGFRGMNQSSGVGQVTFTFQTDGTAANVQYRIAVITAQTSASAYVVNFNDFKIGPQTVPIVQLRNPAGTIIATGSLTPPSGYLYCDGTAVSRTGYSELFAAIGTTYGVGDGSTTFNIPDLRGIFARGAGTNPSNASNTTTMGNRQLDDFKAHVHTSTPIQVAGGTFTSSGNYLGQNGSPVAGPGTQSTGGTETRPANVGVAYHICFSSGYVQTSNDTDTRVVAFRAVNPGASTTSVPTGTAGTVIANLTTVTADTHGAWNSATSTYTIPVSGYYRITNSVYTNSSAMTVNVGIRVNGVGYSEFNSTYSATNTTVAGQLVNFFSAGTTIQPATYHSLGTTQAYGSFNPTAFTIERLSGPSVIAANESVNASCWVSANFAASPTVPINFDSKEFDSHNAVTPSSTAWKFTAPVSGIYQVSAVLNWTTATTSYVHIYKNGSIYKALGTYNVVGAVQGIGSTDLRLNAGDYIDVRVGPGATVQGGALNASSASSNISIKRVGN